MDDGLVLNIVNDDRQRTVRNVAQKGGRWTDRVKAKQSLKRKSKVLEVARQVQMSITESLANDDTRPQKKQRRDDTHGSNASTVHSRPAAQTHRTQVISSLFTSNPKLGVEEDISASHRISAPSNAPLTDRSTFAGLGLNPLIVSHLESKLTISKPTAIQREALPPLLSSISEDTSDRDVFISSQTGSGKTLSFLLPIIQDLLPLSSLSYIDRSIGTLAIIIAPTRELAKQISDVLDSLLALRLRPQDETPDEVSSSSTRLTRWLVSGLLTGGATRAHEKARIRKGLPILVSTPGRLLDHLQNTSTFNVSKCRWLILDEADRLMELGFEETIAGILKALDGRRKLAIQAVEEEKSMEVRGWDWNRRRRTILCSATMKEDVQHLAGMALVQPIVVKVTESLKLITNGPVDPSTLLTDQKGIVAEAAEGKFTPPSQLSQKYMIVPLKLRLVTLVALLRTLLTHAQRRHGTKIIVFFSCTDSVDFHWRLFGSSAIDAGSPDSNKDPEADDAEKDSKQTNTTEHISVQSPLLPETSIFRLHGSLPLVTRLASLKGFASSRSVPKQPESSILLCTSVASRGLDLPLVRAVIQYDLPTEGGATEYVHRVGRTARVGKGGEAWSFVAPSEKEWVKWIEAKIQSDSEKKVSLHGANVESALKSGFGGTGKEYEERATEVQLSFERWVLKDAGNVALARKAYQSHMRAYATHPSDEKAIFHLRHLHIGHLAKSFALRDAPGAVSNSGSSKKKGASKSTRPAGGRARKSGHQDGGSDNDADAERRMREVVRATGRLTKKGGKLVATGTSEFQIAGGDDLEKLVGRR